ncbi:MAG TPA: hypothetical protein VLE97_06610 [Gaiellaceae bacterium]|nr:hypothetical protein [Gaiellaceae bacterium]
MSAIAWTGEHDGRRIEVHADRFSKRRFWVMIEGTALFQRGRMRVRAFTTVEAAVKAARKEAKAVVSGKSRGVPGYSNFGGGGPFAPMGSPGKERP